MRSLAITLILFFSLLSTAGTRIAFLEVYDGQGRLVQYEPNSRFGHSAIEIEGQWLQSYPGEGVKFISWQELQHRGKVAEILEIPEDIRKQDVEIYLGKPFDFQYNWNDEAFYCSELLAKILKIPPQPMQFNHKVWPRSYWPLEGQPGISPDKIYLILQRL